MPYFALVTVEDILWGWSPHLWVRLYHQLTKLIPGSPSAPPGQLAASFWTESSLDQAWPHHPSPLLITDVASKPCDIWQHLKILCYVCEGDLEELRHFLLKTDLLLLIRQTFFSPQVCFSLCLHTAPPCCETKRHLETLSLPSTLYLGDTKLTFRPHSLTNYTRECWTNH